jgi:hypothetical protein
MQLGFLGMKYRNSVFLVGNQSIHFSMISGVLVLGSNIGKKSLPVMTLLLFILLCQITINMKAKITLGLLE